jgi:hypothetical protein
MPRSAPILALLATLALLALPLAGCEFGPVPALPDLPGFEPAPTGQTPEDVEQPADDDPIDPEDAQELPPDYPFEAAQPPMLDGLALMQLDTGRSLTDDAEAIEDEQARDEAEETPEDEGPIEGGYGSFLVGAASLLVMEAGAFVVLAPPSAVLYDTFWNGQITQVAWNAWSWEKTTVVGDTAFVATLSAEITWAGYALEMVVDAAGPDGSVTDWLWYDGLVSFDGEDGAWTMYDFDGEAIALYSYQLDGVAGDLVVLEIELGVLTALVADDARLLSFVDADGAELTVAWDAATSEGSVVHPAWNDGEQACWDGDLANIACPL